MFVQQFFVDGLAHASYLLGGSETCAIIDPKRDVDDYIAAAEEQGMKITHILETHLHADFVSGHRDLAARTGAAIYAPKAGKCRFKHVAVAEGDRTEIEDMVLKVIDTPGHTPDCVCYVVTDRSRGGKPVSVFTGDTLFVGDVGRPDLFPGKADDLASKLYDNLHRKLMKLPDFCEVLPAHGAGSLCGKAMGDKRSSTIGYERLFNHALLHKTKQAFKKALLTGMPDAPDHFARCSDINRKGPAIVADLPALRALSPKEIQSFIDAGHIVVDARDGASFGSGHIPGAYNIGPSPMFSTFAGWVLPPDRPILLVAASPEEIATQLRRVGLDNVVGTLAGGMDEWVLAGMPVGSMPQISVHDLKALRRSGKPLTIVDVRGRGEWDDGHIDGAVHIPFPATRTRYGEIDPNTTAAMVCRSGGRASIGGSILKQHGLKNVVVAAGGMTAWKAAGYSCS